MRSAIGVAAVAGASLLAPGAAWADCQLAGFGNNVLQCTSTTTTNTTAPANPGVDRHYTVNTFFSSLIFNLQTGATINGHGVAVTNTNFGGFLVINNGAIVVDAGNTPTAGGTAALSLATAGGSMTYSGAGDITNNGAGNAFDASQTAGVGSIDLNISGSVFAATGSGVFVRDVTTSTGMVVTTGDITAGGIGVDAQTSSLTGDVSIVTNGDLQVGGSGIVGATLQNGAAGDVMIVANGDIRAGATGIVAGILGTGATGDITVTANGAIDAQLGISASNSGSGSTTVTAVGPINANLFNGIFVQAAGGDVTVTAGDVNATANSAILARQSGGGVSAID
ncbi:MAG: hypothetical protein ACRED4_02225, partial [Brevundimonas sp.]